jgi:hypothetical protein
MLKTYTNGLMHVSNQKYTPLGSEYNKQGLFLLSTSDLTRDAKTPD